MATPSPKSEPIRKALNALTNRENCIIANVCIPPPIGCGKDATQFTDALSLKEYTISGLCQNCQDKFFR